jgi:ABC-type glycerol-3-phosphate transport system permease component
MSAPAAPLARRRSRERIAVNALLLAIFVLFGAPFLWVLAMAFDAHAGTLTPWPAHPTLANFRTLFSEMGMGRTLRNSFVVAGSTMLLATVAAALAGYGLSRVSWKRTTLYAYGLLLLQTIPLSATMVPVFDLTRRLKLQDTYQGLILAHTALTLPFLIWLMKGSFDEVPPMIQEAAELDGCSLVRAWAGILLPLVRPGLSVVAGLAFLSSWAEALMVMVIVRGVDKQTVALRFMTAAQGGADTTVIAALGVLYIAPVLLLFLAIRTQLERGLATAGQAG